LCKSQLAGVGRTLIMQPELCNPNYATGCPVGHLSMHIRKFANNQAEYALCRDAASVQRDVLEAQSAFHNLNHLI
jgi:hypothetical protein